jgi:hypothetical protein
VANAFYKSFLNSLLSQVTPVDFDADSINFVLTDNAGADGAPDVATDDFYDDIDGSTVNSISADLGSKTIGTLGDGVFDAADLAPAWTSVSGATVESITMLKDTTVPSTSPLIGYWDTGVTGLPLTPNGGDVNLSFNGSGIIKV